MREEPNPIQLTNKIHEEWANPLEEDEDEHSKVDMEILLSKTIELKEDFDICMKRRRCKELGIKFKK